MKRPRSRRADAKVRGQPAVGIHFLRGKGQHGVLGGRRGEPLERRDEESTVRNREVEVSIAGHDMQDRAAGHRRCSSRDIERRGRRRQP